MIAVIGCIHGNLEALEAVLEDAERHGVRQIVCLGDLVVFGPDPVACIDLVRSRCAVTVRGHCEQALMNPEHDHLWSTLDALRTLRWSRSLLRPGLRNQEPAARARWQFLRDLPLAYRAGGSLFFHGSPRDPFDGFLPPLRPDSHDPRLEETFAAGERLLVGAHTHLPGLILDQDALAAAGQVEDGVFVLPRQGKVFANAGSVGQPRDEDPRACYLLIEGGDRLRWRRVPYDVERTIQKMQAIPEIVPRFGERLRFGR